MLGFWNTACTQKIKRITNSKPCFINKSNPDTCVYCCIPTLWSQNRKTTEEDKGLANNENLQMCHIEFHFTVHVWYQGHSIDDHSWHSALCSTLPSTLLPHQCIMLCLWMACKTQRGMCVERFGPEIKDVRKRWVTPERKHRLMNTGYPWSNFY